MGTNTNTSSRYVCRLTYDEVALVRSKLQVILSVSEYFATPETQAVQDAVRKISGVLHLKESSQSFWAGQQRELVEKHEQ